MKNLIIKNVNSGEIKTFPVLDLNIKAFFKERVLDSNDFIILPENLEKLVLCCRGFIKFNNTIQRQIIKNLFNQENLTMDTLLTIHQISKIDIKQGYKQLTMVKESVN